MAPIRVNDGLWTNVEDEILKAAIAKYGLNQWSRVSSLLTRKNATQCKLRWQEWLDPRIKKHDWSVDEDKQLLNLAILRPNQWSSIALILNRTANQCIERYQELLTDHTSLENMLDPNDKTLTSKLLLTGNIENAGLNKSTSHLESTGVNHESMPSRPDDAELNEDEREMIMEAKARLANTQGKKAKRKAREKILEESKHIAELLRRRELKKVGLGSKMKFKKKYGNQMDYTADIAFERRPQSGPFDIESELSRNQIETDSYSKSVNVKGTFNQEIEALKRKEKKRQQQNKKYDEISESRIKRGYYEMNPNENYTNELSKRRKFTFSDDFATADVDKLIESTVQSIKDKNTGKSLVFSRKNLEDVNKEPSEKKLAKEDTRKEKEERKHLLDVLQTLADPEDDFDVEMFDLDNKQPIISITKSKVKSERRLIDKTEKKRRDRAKLDQLKQKLDELEVPQSVKRGLPLINTFNLAYPALHEIDSMFLKLTQGQHKQFDSDNISELESTIKIWSEVENRIESSLSEVNKYDALIANNLHTLNSDTIVKMIRFYTMKSNQMENDIRAAYFQKRSECRIDDTLKEIEVLRNETEHADFETWVYSKMYEIDNEITDTRKSVLQKELDNVNSLLDVVISSSD
ncbi:hypothetical protein CANINC_001804 [Pichia inconspicua]|uniref:Pre-mRNA-splicing factor CEF1 n=1 Tax=Pichia inconspicua TaxID=52247 RepID=A0A4T0X4J5_9ASCO|nr:hypothetical protein CANINC_001804 [[Candida] inconspicua]